MNSVSKQRRHTSQRHNPLPPPSAPAIVEPTILRKTRAVDTVSANMPAPTAMLKPTEAPEAVPLPATEQEDELLVDIQNIQDSDFANPSAGLPVETSDDTEMAMDIEGRPKFAPGKDVVRSPLRVGNGEGAGLTLGCAGPCPTYRDQEDSDPAKPHVGPQGQLDKGKLPLRDAPESRFPLLTVTI